MLSALAQHFSTPCLTTDADVENQVEKSLQRLGLRASEPIPCLIRRVPRNELAAAVQTIAQQACNDRVRGLRHADLQVLHDVLNAHAHDAPVALRLGGVDAGAREKRLTYEAYTQVAAAFAAECGAIGMTYFDPAALANLDAAPDGTVSVALVLNKFHALSDRLDLWSQIREFDHDGDGMLDQTELEDALVSIAERDSGAIADSIMPHWRVIAPRKALFLLGSQGRVAVNDIAHHELLDELARCHDAAGAGAANWFAPEKAAEIYAKFCELDADNDGLLTQSELALVRVTNDIDGTEVSSMVDLFLTCVFETHVRHVSPLTRAPAMDLAEFADFLLAWNFRGHAPSVRYFFQALDVEQAGKLSAHVVAMWCQHVAHIAVEVMGALYEYDARDVKDEIFDMVTPRDGRNITMHDLLGCGMADRICGMLVDGVCLYEYDQREALQAQQADAEH